VPAAMRNRGGVEKALLRAALKGLLPEAVLTRKKSPYPKTHHPAYAAYVAGMLSDVCADPNAPMFDFVSRGAVTELCQKAPDNPTPWYGQLMNTPQTMAYFVQLNYWMEQYGVAVV